jgi:hypothetical protein
MRRDANRASIRAAASAAAAELKAAKQVSRRGTAQTIFWDGPNQPSDGPAETRLLRHTIKCGYTTKLVLIK